jgi:uncharacterized protein (DUF433 family)
MKTMNTDTDTLLERLSIDPAVCHGKPCIRGHRIWVTLILDFLASGTSVEELLDMYPDLQREDILACIAYGAEMSRQRFVDWEEPTHVV